jgi:hypothetical protein
MRIIKSKLCRFEDSIVDLEFEAGPGDFSKEGKSKREPRASFTELKPCSQSPGSKVTSSASISHLNGTPALAQSAIHSVLVFSGHTDVALGEVVGVRLAMERKPGVSGFRGGSTTCSELQSSVV